MERLIGSVVFIMAAALIVPIAVTKNPDILEHKSEPTQTLREEQPSIAKVSLSGEERISMGSNGHFITEFRMNGRKVEAMVDTGATMVAINKTTARQLGINVVPADFKYEVSTANGVAKVARAVIDTIEIGSVRVRNVEAAVIDDRALGGTLLGMTFLRQLKSFSVENGELVLKQ